MLVTDWRLADFDELIRNGWPDADPRSHRAARSAPRPASRGSRSGPARARIVRYANTEIVVEVDGPARRDSGAQRHLASLVAGEPSTARTTEILKANVIFRAVLVPRGRHVVRFSFQPFAGAVTELLGKIQHASRKD